MGTHSNRDNLQIGEIELVKEEFLTGRVLCSSKENASLSIIIQSASGQSRYIDQFDLVAGEQELLLNLSSLTTGNYHAWIEVNGQTFIRTIEVSKSHVNTKKGVFAIIKGIFQL